MIDWSNIEDVTAIVEEHEGLIYNLLPDYYEMNNLKVAEVALTQTYILLFYHPVNREWGSEKILSEIAPVLISPGNLQRCIEQHTTETIDDNENGYRRGE